MRPGLWISDPPTAPEIPPAQPALRLLNILVVGADPIVTAVISTALRGEGADIVTAPNGMGALSAARHRQPNLVVVDTRLTDMSAVQFLRTLRRQVPGLPALLLCPAGEEPDRVTRCTAGDTWLVKPFSIEDVLLHARRAWCGYVSGPGAGVGRISVGDLVLDEDSRTVTRESDDIQLTHNEFEVLRYLARNAHRVVTKEQILTRVWPYDYSGGTNVVQQYVSYVRRKVDSGRPPMIHTLRLTGYILKATT